MAVVAAVLVILHSANGKVKSSAILTMRDIVQNLLRTTMVEKLVKKDLLSLIYIGWKHLNLKYREQNSKLTFLDNHLPEYIAGNSNQSARFYLVG